MNIKIKKIRIFNHFSEMIMSQLLLGTDFYSLG